MGFFSVLFEKKDNSHLAAAIKEGAFLVDVRTPSEFSSGSVRGAVNIPLDVLTQELPRFKGKKNIIVFCRSGNRSSQAKHILKQNGFSHVVDGGTWQRVSKLITQ